MAKKTAKTENLENPAPQAAAPLTWEQALREVTRGEQAQDRGFSAIYDILEKENLLLNFAKSAAGATSIGQPGEHMTPPAPPSAFRPRRQCFGVRVGRRGGAA